jgi:hypothetical protein
MDSKKRFGNSALNTSLSPFCDIERTKEPGCELASYLEMAQTSHGGHLEVHVISNFKTQFSSLMVGIALLS